MIKGLLHQEETTVISIHVPISKALSFVKHRRSEGEADSSVVTAGAARIHSQ